MTPLGVTRRIDSQGRIVIPKKLRDQFRFNEGEDYEFYIHEEEGNPYLCIKGAKINWSEVEKAKKMLEDMGYNIS